MDFHPIFSKDNDQNHPNSPCPVLYLKALTSIFWLLNRVSYFYWPAESEYTDIFCHVLMGFHPTFPEENEQNHPNQEPRALKPIVIACLKALTSIFWLVKRVSNMYRPAESENTDIFCHVLMGFHPTFPEENDQNHPNQEPRALKPIAIACLKALTSIFWLLSIRPMHILWKIKGNFF